MPFYVSPEQLMKDRADYARKGIARGRSVVVLGYEGGIAFVAENPSRALHKVSEIYDRLAFAAVGKYNEFENLRVAGVRYADLRGYSYDRIDVTARGLANAYAQTLGTVFTQESKPYEVEIVVAEVGTDADERPDLPADLRRLGRRRARVRRHGRRSRADRDRAQGALAPGHDPRPTPSRWPSSCSAGPRRRTGPRAHAGAARGGGARPRAPASDVPADLGGLLLDRLLSSEDPTTGAPRRGRADVRAARHAQPGPARPHAPTADPEGPEQPGPAQQ